MRAPSEDLDVAQLVRDPHPALARLRERTPVCWVPALEGWLVTSWDLVARVLDDSDTFTVDDPRFTTSAVVGPSMLSLDGAEHGRHRRPFAAAFRPALVDSRYAEIARQVAAGLVDGVRPTGTAEIRSAVAGPFAVAVITRILGLTGVTDEEVLAWYRAIVTAVSDLSLGRAPAPEGGAAAARLAAAVRSAVAGGAPGLLTAATGFGLTVDEIASNAAVIMFGGIETVEGMVSNAVLHLLAGSLPRPRPDDESALAAVVEESLRLEPAAARVDRYASRDTTLAGAHIPGGDLVIASLAAANRDPEVFPDPDRFLPDRLLPDRLLADRLLADRPRGTGHLSFARGPHGCLGAALARRQTLIALQEILTLPGLRLGPSSTTPVGLVFRKPERVVVHWG